MSGIAGYARGRLPRRSIWTRMKGKDCTPHDTPGLAIPSVMQGFTPGDHRDSSLYRQARVMGNV